MSNPGATPLKCGDAEKFREYFCERGMDSSDVDLLIEWYKMNASYDGHCPICGRSDEEVTMCLDHDHEAGEVRGWICKNCNLGLGRFRDDPEALERAIQYVEGDHYAINGLLLGHAFAKFKRIMLWTQEEIALWLGGTKTIISKAIRGYYQANQKLDDYH